jgi:hypothetical protein
MEQKTTDMISQKNPKGFRIQNRDVDVLLFLATMKFADASQVMRACFKVTRDQRIREAVSYVRRRLQILMKEGLLVSIRSPLDFRMLYRISNSGFTALASFRPDLDLTKTGGEIRISELKHDLLVTDSRIFLEGTGRAKDWISEKEIRSRIDAFQDLPARFIPDGAFTNLLNETTLFELELSRKALSRYDEKIEKFAQIANSLFEESYSFKRVLFFCSSGSVEKILREKTRIHGDLFKVERFPEIQKTLGLENER